MCFPAFNKICCRCGAEYKINVSGNCIRKEECIFHWGRLRRHKGKLVCIYLVKKTNKLINKKQSYKCTFWSLYCNSYCQTLHPFSQLLFTSVCPTCSFMFLLSVSRWRLGDQLQLLCCGCWRSRLPSLQGIILFKPTAIS